MVLWTPRDLKHLLGLIPFNLVTIVALLGAALSFGSCGKGGAESPLPVVAAAESSTRPANAQVEVWLTTADQANLVAKQPSTSSRPLSSMAVTANTITIDETVRYQSVDGFGANFSDLTTYLMTYSMSPAERASLMQRLFSRSEGAGFNLIRLAIGANDQVYDETYNDRASTYADNGGVADYSLSSFSIAHDLPYFIPRIQDALRVNPQLKIMATAWWQPSWLVVLDTSTCGLGNGRPYLTVDPQHYDTYAALFVKYVQAYQAHGINIWAVEPQNEPNCSGGAQQNMVLSARGQDDFIKNHLYPAFRGNNITTGIIPDLDNYCFAREYSDTILSDPETSKMILGPAWHGYCGPDATEETIRSYFPATPHYMSEVGYGAPYDWSNLTGKNGGSADLIAEMRNFSQGYIWHAMANATDGSLSNCPAQYCGTLIRIDEATGEVAYDMPFYVLEHFSKFLVPGARRIYSSQRGVIQNVAFTNPDGTKVLVVANTDRIDAQKVMVQSRQQSFEYLLPANSIATFSWTDQPCTIRKSLIDARCLD